VVAAVVGAATKLHALLLHSHLTHGRKTHMWRALTNLLGASAINASTQIMAATALFERAVDLEEVPAVLGPLFGGLAAVLFSAASLQCLCSATPRAGGFRPLRRGSPPASST
jgi:Mn2+/Fe2+ NRAMP family transporter